MSDPTTPDRPTEAPTRPTTPAARTTANGTTTASTGAGSSTPTGDAEGKTAQEKRVAEKSPASDAAGDGGTAESAKTGDNGVSAKTADDGASVEAADNKAGAGQTGAGDDTIEIGAIGAGDKPESAGQPAAVTSAGKAVPEKSPGKTTDEATNETAPGSKQETGQTKAAGKKPWWRRIRVRRGPWLTVGGVVVVLALLAALGYVWGLGPLNRLNAERGITPPAKLGGLDRITDQDIRGQLQLDQTRERLSQINDGKKVTVEAYGSLQGDRLYMLIALRGSVDIDKTVADSGATPEQIKKVGQSTCIETGVLPTQCYRGSNTLTVIAQSGNEDVAVSEVAPVAEEAFNAMK
jgi:hypothetical protein